jgi:hypothetical protein
VEVVLELVIGKVSCLITTSDEIQTRWRLRVKVIHKSP